jgi:DNA polymerase III alpha subunit
MNTMRPRSALRETAKAHGYDEAQIRQFLQRLPQGWHRGADIDDRETLDALSDAGQRRLLRAAAQVVGRPHHAGLHPGGIVITPGPLTDHVPLQWARKGFLSTQFDHVDVEAMGLPKIDLLGIRALTVLADAAALVREHQGATFRLEAIDTQDAQIGHCLSRGQTIGVFQCESTGAQRRRAAAGTHRRPRFLCGRWSGARGREDEGGRAAGCLATAPAAWSLAERRLGWGVVSGRRGQRVALSRA